MTAFNRQARMKENDWLFSFMNGHRLVVKQGYRPIQAAARRRRLRKAIDLERRMGQLPKIRIGGRWIWPKA